MGLSQNILVEKQGVLLMIYLILLNVIIPYWFSYMILDYNYFEMA